MTVTNKRKITTKSRAKNTPSAQKVNAIENMLRVLKREQYKLLTDFMYLSPEDLEVYMDVTASGEYRLTVRSITDKLIDIGELLD